MAMRAGRVRANASYATETERREATRSGVSMSEQATGPAGLNVQRANIQARHDELSAGRPARVRHVVGQSDGTGPWVEGGTVPARRESMSPRRLSSVTRA